MIKRFHAALAAVLSLLVATPVLADYPFQAGGQTITQGATVVGGKSRSQFILYDSFGNPVLTSGNPGYFSLSGPIPAGTNAIGTVGVTSLPALPAGANTIGSVNVLGGNATAVKVDGSAVTQPVSAQALPLPTGAATAANQATMNASAASIDTKTPTVGQKTMTGSSPVAIASDQSAIPVTITSGGINAGTAGSPSADVLSTQGAPGGFPLNTAATPNRSAAADTAASVTSTAAQVLAASTTRAYLALINQSATVAMSCRFGAVPVPGAAGSIDIPAGATRTWGTAYVPTAAVQCVTASGTAALTLQTN